MQTFHDEDEEDYLDETVSATDIDPDVMARHVEVRTIYMSCVYLSI